MSALRSLGAMPKVSVVAPKDLHMLVPRESRADLKARVVYQGPIEAPIAAGQKIAELVVDVPNAEPVTFDLVAGADVPRGGLLVRLDAAARLTRDRAVGLIAGN